MAFIAGCAYDWYGISSKWYICFGGLYRARLRRVSNFAFVHGHINSRLFYKYRSVFPYCGFWFDNRNRIYIQSKGSQCFG